MTLNWTLKILGKVVGAILPVVTPIFRKKLTAFLTEQYRDALETDNPWDDMLFRILLIGCGIPVPEA